MTRRESGRESGPESGPNPGVELVLNHLKETRAFDFTGYKRATLDRRIGKRMDDLGISRHDEYVDYLEVHPEEFEQLFNTILINVTSFFRDAEAWELLRHETIPTLLERKGPDSPIRVWSAGCSSGQEAYSAIMLFADALGIDEAKQRVKVYATDVDEEALEQARQAVYRGRELESLPDEFADRYFEPIGDDLVFRSDLRRTVIFGRHDLMQDAPIGRVDLLLCRNTLMYFNAESQTQLVQRLHYSLAEDGYLMLGKVEMLLGQSGLFEPVDVKQRLFRKVISTSVRARLLAMAARDAPAPPSPATVEGIAEAAFEQRVDAELVLDQHDLVVAINLRARTLFGISEDAIGRPFQDLEISYRPVELRSSIDQARSTDRTIRLPEVARWSPAGDLTFTDIAIAPLASGEEKLGVAITFVDVTRHRQVQEELERTHRELEVAYEELQSSNEELETTNEELQSTIEELETTNEELQSTNEELETMNEELSSTNEELHAINDELRDRTAELDQVNAYLESVLTSFEASVVVIDPELRVRVWNGRSFEMWGIRADEAEGRPFLGLDIGFPVEDLRAPIIAALANDPPSEPVMAGGRNRRGQAIKCLARVNRLVGASGASEGAIIIIEEINGE